MQAYSFLNLYTRPAISHMTRHSFALQDECSSIIKNSDFGTIKKDKIIKENIIKIKEKKLNK